MAQLTMNRRDKTVQFSDLISLSSFHINTEHDIVPYDKESSSYSKYPNMQPSFHFYVCKSPCL